MIRLITTSSGFRTAVDEIVSESRRIRFAYAWMGNCGTTPDPDIPNLPAEKIYRSVVGADFCGTHPETLERLSSEPNRLRIVRSPSGVFHPKIFLGQLLEGSGARILLGSSNFTAGAFGSNAEANVLLTVELEDPFYLDVTAALENWWAQGFSPSKHWLAEYRTRFDRRPKIAAVPPPRPTYKRTSMTDLLGLPWNDYYRLLCEQDGRMTQKDFRVRVFPSPEGSYLEELADCAAAFNMAGSFADIPDPERYRIAGFGPSSGLFGRMTAAARFKEVVRRDPRAIAEALDELPLEGELSPNEAGERALRLMAVPGVGTVTGSRLLVAKRPDLFMPMTRENRRNIEHTFGMPVGTADEYIRLHQRHIWRTPWFNADEPVGAEEGQVWRGRVALLDCILYEGGG